MRKFEIPDLLKVYLYEISEVHTLIFLSKHNCPFTTKSMKYEHV